MTSLWRSRLHTGRALSTFLPHRNSPAVVAPFLLRRGRDRNDLYLGEQWKGFTGKFWRNGLLVVILGLVWYNVDQHLYTSEEKHPITKWIEYYMTPGAEWRQETATHLGIVESLAQYKLFKQEAKRPPMPRMRYPEVFEAGSPHLIPVGSQCDLSDLKVRYD